MDDEEFRSGAIDIQWLERRLSAIVDRKPAESATRIAAISAALLAERDRSSRVASEKPAAAAASPVETDSWKQAARLESLRS
jgi:hypothetical protein